MLLCLAAGRAADDLSSIRAALDRGDLDAAEQALEARFQAHPMDTGTSRLAYETGLGLGKAGEFNRAESMLTHALSGDPANFKTLYNLGVAASFAGHPERGREVLNTALKQQPQNVDVLYSLAYVNQALKQWEEAAGLLARAGKIAPRRPDIQKLLAISTTELHAYSDAAAAWDRYLALQPNDDLARRERGAALVRSGQFEKGIADLEWFTGHHAGDAAGHYELGVALTEREPEKALLHLNQALQITPDFAAARSSRGGLYYQMGKPETALPDLEIAARLAPHDAVILDQLGQTYQVLDRTSDAVRVLSQAAELAPGDSKIQLHYGRALADAGRTAESQVAMDRFRQLGPSKNAKVPAGLVDYLSLTPAQRAADYRTRVEKAVTGNPDDVPAQLRYLKLMLEDGKPDEAAKTARRIVVLSPGAEVLADAGRLLLAHHQYSIALELLKAGTLDHAIAAFRSKGAAEGLRLMHRVPQSDDCHVARAQMLIATGKLREALADLEQAPESREAQLLKAGVLELDGQAEKAERQWNEIQIRRPEWYPVWLLRGLILSAGRHAEESLHSLETAKALGARTAPKDLLTFLLMPPADW